MQYRDRLNEAEARYNELTAKMADPSVINDPEQYRKTAKAQSELAELVGKYREYQKVEQELNDARLMLNESDPELQQMAASGHDPVRRNCFPASLSGRSKKHTAEACSCTMPLAIRITSSASSRA